MTIPSMTCPQCHQEMELRKQDTSHTKEKTKFYNRQFLVCRQDDIWMRLETPTQITSDDTPER